jgi:hypothetical protein
MGESMLSVSLNISASLTLQYKGEMRRNELQTMSDALIIQLDIGREYSYCIQRSFISLHAATKGMGRQGREP